MNKSDRFIKISRFARIILGMISIPLFLLLFVVFGGALIIYFSDNQELNGSFAKAVYAILSISSFTEWKNFPTDTLLQIMYFVVPVLGLTGGISLVGKIFASALSMKTRTVDWEVRLASLTPNPIVICGLGKIGTQVMKDLISKGHKWNIVGVHDNPDESVVYEFRKSGIPVIIGDMTTELTLLQANIKNASSVILATENDKAHYKTLLKLNEIVPHNISPVVIFNVFDSRVAELIKDFDKDKAFRLKLRPVDLSKELALSFFRIIEKNNISENAKYALCGLGRVGFQVVNILHEKGIALENLTIIDNNLQDNIFIKREPIISLPEGNSIEMDIVDFYCIKENKYDVCIITTGDDLSNLTKVSHFL